MFIIKRVRPFVKNRAKRQTIGMPKLQMVDTGLACHLLGLTSPAQLLQSNFYGGLLESFVVMECFKHMGWSQQTMKVYHYRDKRKNEVDIVLYTGSAVLPFQIGERTCYALPLSMLWV
ncbi:MAG: AAA family ATPase [uncultured Thiotrichaceae bacterium]|uniref:AAA family ATPase n=1 Tax=uncultured Thiotrichaceae bacterium TaxID=298394 RepID=A0A6S6UHQ3_9GAMM|nr:MAG: AAA family ATPase [uncultured Thiotrichaceae bacterium]